MKPEQIPTQVSEIIWRDTADGAVLIAPSTGKLQVFNTSGAYIWQLIDGKLTIGDIQAYVSRHFDITEEQASKDISHFLTELSDKGLISWS
jgi:hypothetical protein